jgi:ribosomal protein S18 acetylase RimI-like enzyme
LAIRDYLKGDCDSMARIAPRAFMGLGLARYAIDRGLDRERVSDYYSAEILGYARRVEKGEEPIHILVAELHGRVTAYIVVALDDANTRQFGLKWGRIISLAVDPEYQGRGIGKALVRAGLEWLSRHGAVYVEVLTDQNNVAAQRAYEASGFRAIYASISYSARIQPTS